MPDQVEPALKKERSARLIELGRSKRKAFAAAFVGREVSLLVERVSPEGVANGWTGQYLPARISRPQAAENDIIMFLPTQTDGDILLG
jgi:threonylcarbamoyladenosine tRNA methylthiotransferase MtaB